MVKRPKAHQIDDRAQAILRELLPHSWVSNDQRNDYAKDFLVEVGDDDDEMSGDAFYVQLKGQENPTFVSDGHFLSFSLETKHAKYYLDNVKDLPVFLVVVDVTSKKGYWLFLQEFLDELDGWRKRKSVAIRIPVQNELSNSVTLHTEVTRAKKWLRLRHPESIHDAIAARAEQIRKRDDRFDVEITATGKSVNHKLLPKENVKVKLIFRGDRDKLNPKLDELVNKGQVVEFAPGELAIDGTKLFDDLVDSPSKLQVAINLEASATLTCLSNDYSPLGQLPSVPGRLSGGLKQGRFTGNLDSSPLALEIGPLGTGLGGAVKTDLKFNHWNGQRLLQLAYFDKILGFVSSMTKATRLDVAIAEKGNKLVSFGFSLGNVEEARFMTWYLDYIHKARRIATRFGVNPVWDSTKMDDDCMDAIDELYAVFFEDGLTKALGSGADLEVSFAAASCDIDALCRSTRPEAIRLTSQCTRTLLGVEFDVGALTYEYTNMVVDKSALRRDEITVTVSFRTTDLSKMRVWAGAGSENCNPVA